ncbi:uncharacterized protein LOC132910744 [Bombus pascuorum]|uniref:uncharacterized protein LOC132910744 n=1 Tax=Bombus pascuorum TaxID=65598 RepID=UPI00298DEF5A|nr:uncharacterized protein LOC132910744 [Bombus pascuorum]XP_060822683.1 uncharacterized protein LOC132910744 [Bombus pascuorum]
MFCLGGRNSDDTRQDDFGWWLSNEDGLKSPRSTRSKDHRSVGSSESMFSCIDSDDSESYALAQEFKQECNGNYKKIELTSLINEDCDVNLIELDAIREEGDAASLLAEDEVRCSDDSNPRSQDSRGTCYTPERLVRSQNYRILAPSPPYLSISQMRDMPDNPRKTSRCRHRLDYTIDSNKDDGTQMKTLTNPNPKEIVVPTIDLHRWKKYEQVYSRGNRTINDKKETKTEDMSDYSSSLNVSDYSFSKRSSCERLNDTWENSGKMETRNCSSGCSETTPFEDTSGIQSNDSTSNTHTSNMQSTPPLCLSDELPTTNYSLDTTQRQRSTTNKVESILEVLDTNPEKAMALLEKDSFHDSISSHDQSTRLALTIETDENMLRIPEKEQLIHLQNKIKKLQAGNKEIYQDISDLRKNFKCEEQKITDISSKTSKLRQDIHDLRYLDDLLHLLRGELSRISERKWPFVIGRIRSYKEEMNLIV